MNVLLQYYETRNLAYKLDSVYKNEREPTVNDKTHYKSMHTNLQFVLS